MTPSDAVHNAEHQLGETPGYSILHRGRWVKTLGYLETYCPPATHPKVLDVGVWPGYQSLALVNLGYAVTGLDLDPNRLPPLPFSVKSIDLNNQDTFPVSDHSLDVVVATEIIEHLAPARVPGFIAAVQTALRPGGYLLVTTPNRHQLGATVKSRVGGTDDAGHGHTREYTNAELHRLFSHGWWRVIIERVDMYAGVGKISNEQYYRPLGQWWRQPRRMHNALKVMSGAVQRLIPAWRDTIVLVAET